ncbi:MAG: DUF4393 domain-containing protein, partial [Duodenibacillus sp.]|nr:DUF4393 domain-containing protein [Duodenibacillus sp.]
MNQKNSVLAVVAEKAYDDIIHPVAKPTGQILSLLPQAIYSKLVPLREWIAIQEHNFDKTLKLLSEKMSNVPPESIVSPEPYVAVPALQNLSYCMDRTELREMYANLLAHSMTDIQKAGVHPGFVEIIKQLSPDEAKILRNMANDIIPTITLRYETDEGGGIDFIKHFSDIGEKSQCDTPYETNKCFDNLVRLGLIEKSELQSLTNKTFYEELKQHPFIQRYSDPSILKDTSYTKV